MKPVKVIGECGEDVHGTKVTFWPDPTIFEETVFDYSTLKERLRETAFLTKRLKINLQDEREGSEGAVAAEPYLTVWLLSTVPL